MTLRFYAARDALVHERHGDGAAMATSIGAAPRYVGRGFVPGTTTAPAAHPANDTAYECSEGTAEASYLIRECQAGDLHPADKDTAQACGVPFTEVEFNAGVWVPRARPKSAAKKEG